MEREIETETDIKMESGRLNEIETENGKENGNGNKG